MYNYLKAYNLAYKSFDGVFRKFEEGSMPYIRHLERVTNRLMRLHLPQYNSHDMETLLCISILHDYIEDIRPNDGRQYLRDALNEEISYGVFELTNASIYLDNKLLRAEKKKADREKLKDVSHMAKLVKLSDRIDNVRSLDGSPVKYQRKYVAESIQLYNECLKGTHTELENELLDEILKAQENIDAFDQVDINRDMLYENEYELKAIEE